ncbi:MAG: preprotein translocase subunit SecG [Gaiellales bacterium]|nr:MAG: preprotein translocase subunit SecG [Gaiellales bacterium]
MSFIEILVLAIHSILALLVVVLVLLHSGKGGVSGIFGGGMSETFSGTSVIEKNLTRVTVVVSVAFFITTGLLVFVLKT